MKSSQDRKSLMARGAFACALLAASAIGTTLGPVSVHPASADTTTTTPQYQPWTGAAAQQIKNLIAELKTKIASAEQSQAASPDFLADLKALAAKYEALQAAGAPATATGPAPGTQVFSDTFADGDYTSSPTWKVSAGTWRIDASGTNRGLASEIKPQKTNLNSVLGALLQPQGSTQSQQTEFASIYTAAKIPNAFTLKATFTSRHSQGSLNLGVYQGASGSAMYRMVYQPGTSPGLVIQKVTSSGATTIASYNSVVDLDDKKPHELTLSRDAQGNMKLLLDGNQAASGKDTSLTGDMNGLLFVNNGGSYYIRSVTVTAN